MKKDTSMAFDGMSNGNTGGYSKKYQHRAEGIPAPRENYGRGPTVAGRTGDSVPNPTAKSGKINGGASVKPMKSNFGRGPTKGCC